jgi:hypothetical protein
MENTLVLVAGQRIAITKFRSGKADGRVEFMQVYWGSGRIYAGVLGFRWLLARRSLVPCPIL